MEWIFLEFRTKTGHVYVQPDTVIAFHEGTYGGTGSDYVRLYLVGGTTIDVRNRLNEVARMFEAPTK